MIHEADDLTPDQMKYLQQLFREEIFPVLTPIAVDPAHPFPFIPNLGFTLAFELMRPGTTHDADRAGARARPISTASSRCPPGWRAKGGSRS